MTPDLSLDDAPVVGYLHKILQSAIAQGASDIHIEPYDNRCRIRARFDGLLSEIATPPYHMAPRLASRLKILSQCDIAEKRLPQDGRFKITLPHQQTVELRVSTCPTQFGEKVVLRILDPSTTHLQVDNLGLEEHQQTLFLEAVQRPQGLILVTGPTGSGKTVTLYTALHRLNTRDKNIMTIEDPIEMYQAGINQVNINPKAGLHFATALRAFLRQDPDIIMVGEMRDHETADIAIKAAQTGHLVLSTVHTNSAVDTITRLLHLGIAPFHLTSALTLIIAQRLVRCLCPHCKQWDECSASYTAIGCEHCHQGYKGRTGIYELMPLSPLLCHLIETGQPSTVLEQQLQQEQHCQLRQSARLKVQQGITSLTELQRVLP